MKIFAILSILALVVVVGCSREEPPAQPSADLAPDETIEAQETAPEEPVPQPPPLVEELPESALQEDLQAVQQTLANQDYATVVDQLGAMSVVQGQMTEAQRRAYQQQLFYTQQYLIEKAKRDAAAQQALDRLGRQMMGR